MRPLLDMREEVRPQLIIEFVEVFSALVALSARLAMSQATGKSDKTWLLSLIALIPRRNNRYSFNHGRIHASVYRYSQQSGLKTD